MAAGPLLSLPAAGHEKNTLDFSKMLFRSSILRLFGFSTFLHVNCFLIEKKLRHVLILSFSRLKQTRLPTGIVSLLKHICRCSCSFLWRSVCSVPHEKRIPFYLEADNGRMKSRHNSIVNRTTCATDVDRIQMEF